MTREFTCPACGLLLVLVDPPDRLPTLTCGDCGTTIPTKPPPAAASFTGTRTVKDLEKGAEAIRRTAEEIRRGKG